MKSPHPSRLCPRQLARRYQQWSILTVSASPFLRRQGRSADILDLDLRHPGRTTRLRMPQLAAAHRTRPRASPPQGPPVLTRPAPTDGSSIPSTAAASPMLLPKTESASAAPNDGAPAPLRPWTSSMSGAADQRGERQQRELEPALASSMGARSRGCERPAAVLRRWGAVGGGFPGRKVPSLPRNKGLSSNALIQRTLAATLTSNS